MPDGKPRIAIVGATGAVGRELIDLLAPRDFPFDELRLFASARSAGTQLACGDRVLPVEELTEESFGGIDIAFFSAGSSISRTFAPIAAGSGTIVIDNSSAFRTDERIPLVIPEVNGHVLDDLVRKQKIDPPNPSRVGASPSHPSRVGASPSHPSRVGASSPPGDDLRRPGSNAHQRPTRATPPGPIISNPNCSTILALLAVTPLHRAATVQRMVVNTYQAASGAGAAVMAELQQQARDYADGRPYTMEVTGRQYLFNLFSHNSAIGPGGYNEEELKMMRETRRIWNDDAVRISATCVRVPVLRAHSEAINLTFEKPLSEADARALLAEAPGVRLVDDREGNHFPEPIHASGRDEVLVGRIRGDISQPEGKGLDLFVSGDQLRKGAALNAIQIAEHLLGLDRTRAASRAESLENVAGASSR